MLVINLILFGTRKRVHVFIATRTAEQIKILEEKESRELQDKAIFLLRHHFLLRPF